MVRMAEPADASTRERTRIKVRERVARGSRSWRLKVAVALVLALIVLGACITVVPHMLSSFVSEGGEQPQSPEASPHP